MIAGTVNFALEAIVRLHVEDAQGQTQPLDLKIDTAFTGFVSLPVALVVALGLPFHANENVLIADGSIKNVPVHHGVVIWDGRPRTVEFFAMGRERLIGTAMLAGHDLAIRVQDGGAVTITLVP